MAFANWKSKKPQSATATLATVATHEEKTGDYLPSVATVATVAGLESLKSDRYAHLITCQQCEHLSTTGHCSAKTQYKPQPEAMRDCASFETVKGERVAIANAPYSVTELNDLLNRYEKKLFHHLVDCVACSFMDSRYCVDAFAIGSSYDAMLLVFDDAASKREALLNAVIRARISGRSVFVSLDHNNQPAPQLSTFFSTIFDH